MRFICVGLIVFWGLLSIPNTVLCQEQALDLEQPDTNQQEDFVGEFFNIKVPAGNYLFIRGVFRVFGNRWGGQPRTEKELEEQIWEQLLLSYEAHRWGITISQYELEEEIKKLLSSEKAGFDYKDDKEAYSQWVKDKTNEEVLLFENQLRHLLQIEKLRQQVMDNIQPEVSEDEAYQEFLNEYNALSLELIQFEEEEEAKKFYKKARRTRRLWDKEKEANPDKFRRPGFVSLEFLIDIWKLPKKAVYDMMKLKSGLIYGPSPIYKGYGVFRVLKKRPAEKEKFSELEQAYFKQIKEKKQMQGYSQWLQNLKQEANIKIYKPEQQKEGQDEG